jgi:hypothetical protein
MRFIDLSLPPWSCFTLVDRHVTASAASSSHDNHRGHVPMYLSTLRSGAPRSSPLGSEAKRQSTLRRIWAAGGRCAARRSACRLGRFCP